MDFPDMTAMKAAIKANELRLSPASPLISAREFLPTEPHFRQPTDVASSERNVLQMGTNPLR